MKKLFLIFHGRFPSEKAASLFAAKSAEAFAERGLRVILVAPRRLGRASEAAHSYYRIKDNFKVVYLPAIDLYFLPLPKALSFWISFISFSTSSFLYLLAKASRADVVYSNETLPLFLASFCFPDTFYEMHDFPESKFPLFGFFLGRMKWVLIHNNWKTEQAIKEFGMSRNKIITEPNAVEVADFDIDNSKEAARRKLNFPIDKKIAVYTGHLYSWKGVDTMAEAADKLPDDYILVFVGGTADDIRRFKERYGANKRILIAGFKPHSEIPLWQKAADVLVLPNTAKENISKYYTSPMKLFEYAASKRPIVASDIPSVRELVDNTRAILVAPDNAGELADGIKKACENKALSSEISSNAYSWVLDHTWSKRAERIINFMDKAAA